MKSNGCETLLNILQKNYNKATICINKLITSFSPFDIKCIKLNLMQKTSGNVFLRHLRGRVFHIFPRLHSVMGGICIPLRGNILLHGMQSAFCLYLRTGSTFLFTFYSSDPSFNWNLLRSLYLKFKISAHAHIAMTYYYVLFTNFLKWYEF